MLLAVSASLMALSGGPSPNEWREFRARLVAGQSGGGTAGSKRSSSSSSNDLRLRQIDEKLWQEYTENAWAHQTSLIEPGSLLCALPIQGQLIQSARWGGDTHWPATLRAALTADDREADGASSSISVMERWLGLGADSDPAAMALAWKSSTSLCNAGLASMRSGMPNRQERELWSLQCAALERRGRVCLVLGQDDSDVGGSDGDTVWDCLVQTKTLASEVSADLARRLLAGQREAWSADPSDVEMVRAAFGNSPVYWGGPDALGAPVRIVHGRSDLVPPSSSSSSSSSSSLAAAELAQGTGTIVAGSRELAPGTRLYVAEGDAALLAAARAVVDGVAQPFEFRLSLGRTRLDTWEARTAWMPVACSRLLAVKPSTGAGQPKSMWHEVMGMCGGECAEIGRLVKAEMDGGGKPRNPNRPRGDSDI